MTDDELVEMYLPQMLSWAVRKTGNRHDAEDLTQEVFNQLFIAISKGDKIEKMDHFIRKVAYYCWCNYLRGRKKDKKSLPLSEGLRGDGDVLDEVIAGRERDDRLIALRRQISNLSGRQREIMIMYYLDGRPVEEISGELHLSKNAVTWHLFDARGKVRRELENMDANIDYLYRPGRLMIGSSGDEGPDPDTKYLRNSLIRQNLCLICYRQPKGIEELTSITGIPRPYLEFDLDWLVGRELMSLEGKRYLTAFPIITGRHRQDVATMFRDTRPELIDRIIEYLWEREQAIREIGFYGSGFPSERLMWGIITMFISYVSRSSPLLARLKSREHYPIRPDGGKYVVIASDATGEPELDPDGYSGEILWGGFSGIWSGSCLPGSAAEMYYWLGVNSFSGRQYCPDIATADQTRRALLHFIYSSAAEPWFDESKLEAHGREALAEAVADGLIAKDGDRYRPQYLVFTQEQLDRLRNVVYKPLAEIIEPTLGALGKRVSAMHRADFPKNSARYIDYHTYLDLWNFGIYTLMYAALDGRLWMPGSPEQGVPLTLVIVG